MFNVSDKFNKEINKLSGRMFNAKVIINGKEYNGSKIYEMNLEESVNPGSDLSIGTMCSSSFNVKLINTGELFDNAIVKPYVGLYMDETIEYIPLGVFTVLKANVEGKFINLECVDNMVKLEQSYFSELMYPANINDIALEICRKANVNLTSKLPNYQVEKLDGYSLREAIGIIASLCGSYSRFDRLGNLEIKGYDTTTQEITPKNIFKLDMESKECIIKKVIAQKGDKEISLGDNEGNSIIFDNPIITEDILNDIYSKYKDFRYIPYTAKWKGNPAIMAGDILKLTDLKGNKYNALVMEQKFTYKNGISSEIKAKGNTNQESKFDSNGSVTKVLERFSIEQASIKKALIDKADITDLNAVNANIQLLKVDVGKINTLINGNLSSENIQAGGITSDKLTIANGFITNAMIANLDVAKINAGDISTNKFRITSDSGNMLISDNTIQIRDKNRVRVQIGKDASNDYNMYVWDANGNLMFDATGLKANGIKEKIIRDDMISDNANIDGHKLNINSVVTQINNGSTKIESSKVQINGINQTLDVAFNSLKSQSDNNKSLTESHSTTIGVMQGQIKVAIDNTTIVKDGQTILLKDAYNHTVNTVESMKSTIGSHTTKINEQTGKINSVETKINTVERNLNGMTMKVSKMEATTDELDDKISDLTTRMSTAEVKILPASIINTVSSQFYNKNESDNIYANKTVFEQTKDDFLYKFENSGKPNELINSNFTEIARGWTIYQEGNTGAFVEYSDGFNGVEPVGTYCMTIHNANAVGGYGYAMQKFKPRNPRMINFTVGGCYHYDDIRVWTEEPYPLAYIYVVVVNKDGTREYYNQDEVMRNNQYIGWQTYSKTFGRIGKEIDWVEFYVFKRSTTGTFRITNLDFHEGTEHRKWRPSGEIYSNTTKIDGEGIEIIHNNGSKSRLSHEKIEFTAPNGNATLRIKDGGLNLFTATNNEMCGFVKPSQIKQDWYNGVTISTYASGDYVAIGHSKASTETSWESLPSILIAKNDNFELGNYWEGINFVNQKVLLRTRTHLKNVLDIDPIGSIELYCNSSTPHKIFNSTANNFCIMGDNNLRLGVRVADKNVSVLEIIESDYERVQNWHHWNFHNWTMWNMKTASTLMAQSQQLRSRTKDINDIYGVYSMTDGEIRYTCREPQHIGSVSVDLENGIVNSLDDRSLLVELPQILAENIENDYHINIGKISGGDYRIVEKNPYYFIIESDVDNFQFTYEIVGKKLFNEEKNAVIANYQYELEDMPEEVEDAKVVFDEDNGQIGKESFWKMYTNEFLRSNINNKTLKFTSPS
ncbi:hypothetical protein WS9_003750 [Paraclostridium sordellii 8483]|uniref:hypothetical protein n=1 Tax=Paraclostridium sordellii TaxID=1505 RepID=UPI0002D303AE|nr:hypothetical protein [Paeniclostridium sordellii]TAN69146.1 hypothetical protein WS9_003750 [Paeniclostridium sordellii 8483]